MSRRPNQAADRAEQNRQTLKTLVKLEPNKSCADCKRNKHPRWASWNLGIFICIRCSGIHRGMGTHISRVKSVDLDSWTDEQLQSVIKWGNARANKYWEAKLAPGHVPSEAKIENFIRTKYESKRWVMDGGIPDPSTLDVSDDDVPLSKVQERVGIERSASQRLAASAGRTAAPQASQAPAKPLVGDLLFGDEPTAAPARPSTGPPIGRTVPPKAEPAPPKQTKAGDSLLGLDFLGGASSQPARPSSTGPAAAGPSRPDLKQSILSLYASAPKPAPQPQAQQHARQDSFGGLASPGFAQPQHAPQQSSLGGLNDAFSDLSFNSQPAAPQAKPSPFAGLDSLSKSRSPASTSSSNLFGGGGSFFDSTPKPAATPQSQTQRRQPSSSGFGDFSSSLSSPTAAAPPKPASPGSGLNDLLDLSMPAAAPSQPISSPAVASPSINSAFNLSSHATPPAPAAANHAPVAATTPSYSAFSTLDAWGSNDVWASSGPSQPAATTTTATTTVSHVQPKSPGWAATTPHVTQDDDFGGWSSAAPTTSTTTSNNKSAGGFGGDDLFSNVWE